MNEKISAADVDRANLDKNPSEVAGMFNKVAKRYDATNAALSFGTVWYWRHELVKTLAPKAGQKVLDLAAGTGRSTASLAKTGADVVGADLSEGMLDVARKTYPDLKFVQANATNLPFEDNAFDAATISFGLRNIVDTRAALKEMARVVRPGGRLLVCEFSHPQNKVFNAAYSTYNRYALPRIARLVSSDDVAYDYLTESITDWPDQESLKRTIGECGWRNVKYRNLTFGIVAFHTALAW
ncbi:bifunctional demethylmenaquinone methyltransferase/2-methoxy-6-polyprenyl-1,4-benzoquinol methylase UbiE [Gleimia hominis]|uniref:Demethylmenaquinone methyltransferase n=1 Tax=Gleimia hominis TaxID=595468 RepID=A0ABU3IC93_9ACTO|nr:bifunctional demethylmenaquinone methyltransferase/2-methoxy-6-polyprenyl-1,4-benzoquinol methylase UbiE [Gleimia hominis]MDT3767092.1 bifunctional demethylmenaquinone methyltransferase/2-methoxy-6-polyprenyl-1,4-benzoquinol methylase UbiE [Gleimia hominis]